MRIARLTLEDKIIIKRVYSLGKGQEIGNHYGVSRQYIHVIKNDPSIVVPKETSKPKWWQRFFLFWGRR